MNDEMRQELQQIKQQLEQLTQRLQRLERRIEAKTQAASAQPASLKTPSVAPPPATPAQPIPTPRREARPVLPTPSVEITESATSNAVGALEHVLGSKVALYTGIVLLFIATAFFLGWAWTRLTPEGRLAMGYLGGFALIGLGVAARHRSDEWFIDGLMGAGLATLYLSTWAGWGRYALLGFAEAFGVAALTTGVGVGLALWRNSETLAIVATLGGFSAPVWLRGDGSSNSPLNFFGYLTVLNAGMLAVATAREWRVQQATCLVATVVLLVGWALESYKPEFNRMTLSFLTVYYVLFSIAYLLPASIRREPTGEIDLAQFTIASLIYLPYAYLLARELWQASPGALLAVAGVIYLVLSVLKYRLQDAYAAATLLTLGVVCLLGAIAVELQRAVQAVVYSLLTAGLLVVSLRYQLRLVYGYGVVLALITAVVVFVTLLEPIRTALVLLNEHGVALLAWLVGMGVSLWALHRSIRVEPTMPLDGVFPREVLGATTALGILVGLLWLSAEQTLYAFELAGQRGAPQAHMLVSLEWTVIGAGLLLGGVHQAIRALRLMGLSILGFTVFKLFLYDLSFLQMPYRVFSFAGLGLTLIGVAWLYSRFGRADQTSTL